MLQFPTRKTVFRKLALLLRQSAVLLLSATVIATSEPGLGQVTDLESLNVPSVPRPGYLEPMEDPVFGTKIIRVTDAGNPVFNPTNDPSLDSLSWEYQTGHGYSSRSAWNADQSLLMLEKGVSGSVYLDGATYKPLFRRSNPGAVRWHPSDPETLLYVDRNDHCLGAYEPRTHTHRWKRCYSGYDSFQWSDPGKGKPSLDGNIIPIRAQRSSDKHWVAFLYYVDSDSRSDEIDMSVYVEPGDDPDFVMSPLGDTIIIVGCVEGHTGRCVSQVSVDVATRKELWRNLNYHDPGHADEAVDANGEQWRIGVAKEGEFKGEIIKRNFRTGEGVSLIPHWGSHTSTRGIAASRNMAIVTYHNPSDSPLWNEVVGVCLDGSCFERYAHTHRADTDDYLAESHGSVSSLGNRIVFRSNWDSALGPIDAYVVEIGTASAPEPEFAPEPEPTPEPEPEPDPVQESDQESDSTTEPTPPSWKWGKGGKSGDATSDGEPPVVEILSPYNGQTIMPNTNIWIEVDATDNAQMQKIEIRIDRKPWITLTGEGPYGVTWTAPPEPETHHRIEVTATDVSGNTATDKVGLRTANVK